MGARLRSAELAWRGSAFTSSESIGANYRQNPCSGGSRPAAACIAGYSNKAALQRIPAPACVHQKPRAHCRKCWTWMKLCSWWNCPPMRHWVCVTAPCWSCSIRTAPVRSLRPALARSGFRSGLGQCAGQGQQAAHRAGGLACTQRVAGMATSIPR